jgi:hypothetical protein
MKKTETEKELKKYKRAFWTIWVTLIALCCFVVYIFFFSPTYYNEEDLIDRIYFDDGFAFKEKQVIYGIVNELKPEYRNTIKELFVERNISETYQKLSGSYKTLNGYNRLNKIHIQYTDNHPRLKRTICHEVLHNIVSSNIFDYESYVYDIADYGVCYR